MAKLPRLRRALELAMETPIRPTGIPVRVLVVSTSMWIDYLQPSPGITSEFVPTRFRNYIIADNTRIERGGLFHEHTHLFLYTQMLGTFPAWFDEGFAQMMEYGQYAGNKARFFPTSFGDTNGWLPTARVLRVTKDSPEYLGEAHTANFHFQSRAMVQRALMDDTEFGKKVFAYITALNDLKSPDEAEKAFGMTGDELDYQMRAYVNRSSRTKVRLDLGEVAEVPLPDGTPLSKLDSLMEIITVSLDTGLGVARVEELLDAADKEAGGRARTLVPRLRLAAQRKDDARLVQLYQDVGPQLASPAVARDVGLALFERVQTLEQKPAVPAQAAQIEAQGFELLNRALASTPDDPQAVWAYATLAARLDRDLDVALKRLMPMFERLPRNPDMAHAAALVLAARNDPGVGHFYNAVFKYAHTLDEKRWAAEQLGALGRKSADAAGQ
jgi:hypothetical protein